MATRHTRGVYVPETGQVEECYIRFGSGVRSLDSGVIIRTFEAMTRPDVALLLSQAWDICTKESRDVEPD